VPEQFEEVENDKSQSMTNCTILHYSRNNPHDPHEVRDKLSWRRIVNPTDIASSPFGGDWLELPPRPMYTGADLLSQVERSPRLITFDE